MIQELRVQIASVANSASGSGPSGGGGPHKSLLDPKSFSLETSDGDKGEKEDFEEWREDLEEQLDHFYPGIKEIWERQLEQPSPSMSPTLMILSDRRAWNP